jgi:hypothetical protein
VRQTAEKLFAVNKGDGALSALDVDLWRGVYPDVSAEGFLEALRSLARTGQTWMPKAPQFAAILAPPTSPTAVTWSEVWSAITVQCRTCKNSAEAGATVERLLGPVAGAWVASSWNRIQASDVGDPEYGPGLVGMFGKQFDAYNAAQTERIERGLSAPSAAAVLGQGDGLRKLNWAAQFRPGLEAGEAA